MKEHKILFKMFLEHTEKIDYKYIQNNYKSIKIIMKKNFRNQLNQKINQLVKFNNQKNNNPYKIIKIHLIY